MIRAPKISVLDTESREVLIMLKKILFSNCILKELRDMTPQIFKKNAWVALGGIDSVNCHFSGKQVHSSLVELVVVGFGSNNGGDESNAVGGNRNVETPGTSGNTSNQINKTLEEIADILVKTCNDKLMELANMETMSITKGLVEKASPEAAKTGVFFSKRLASSSSGSGMGNSAQTMYIDYHLPTKQPFIEIKVIGNCRILDRYGVKFIALKDVQNTLNTPDKSGASNASNPSITFDREKRLQTFEQALSRKDLTFTNSCMKALIRLCYPAYHMRKLESYQEVERSVEGFFGDRGSLKNSSDPGNPTNQNNALKNMMLQELKDHKNDAQISNITLRGFMERSASLGLLPPLNQIDNDYNDNVLYETKTELLG